MYNLETVRFGSGAHKSREDGMCMMEAVAWVAGERHSDRPQCACPVISQFCRTWNDALNDDDRTRLLMPYVFRLVGTRSTKEIEQRRSFMCYDWLVRVCLPTWLELTPSLREHADKLRSLPEITNKNTIGASVGIVGAAKDAAKYAVVSASWSATIRRPSALNATRNAALDASWSATIRLPSALNATRNAALNATRDAAWSVAQGAAVNSTWFVLRPTVTALQQSACDLLDRMIQLTEVKKNHHQTPAGAFASAK